MTNYEWLQKNGISLSDLRVAYINGLTVLYTVELEYKVYFLIKVLKFIISQSDFELLNRIEIKDKKSGRMFR